MFLKIILPKFFVERSRRWLSGALNRTPRLKRALVKGYLILACGPRHIITNDEKAFGPPHDTGLSDTHRRLLELTREHNTFNPYHTPEVNRLFLALKTRDRDTLKTGLAPERRAHLIVSCYLFTLRRYPGRQDIDTWSAQIDKGASVYTLLDALMNSVEFQLTGAYYLEKG